MPWLGYQVSTLEHIHWKHLLILNRFTPPTVDLLYDPVRLIFTTPRTYLMTCIYVTRDYTLMRRILRVTKEVLPLSVIWFGSRLGFVLEVEEL